MGTQHCTPLPPPQQQKQQQRQQKQQATTTEMIFFFSVFFPRLQNINKKKNKFIKILRKYRRL